MIRVFIGYDHRQPLAYNVLQHSIVANSSQPVSITPLIIEQLPIKRRGLTDFTFSRFLVPYLCNYTGHALFLDADMVVTGDIAELFANVSHFDHMVRIQSDQARFEWASAMLFNCYRCHDLTPQFIDDESNVLFDFKWCGESEVGLIPKKWNHCVGYAESASANLYHYTQGLPCWEESSGLEEDTHWNAAFQAMNHTVSWEELMGTSVHAKHVLNRMMKRYELFRRANANKQAVPATTTPTA